MKIKTLSLLALSAFIFTLNNEAQAASELQQYSRKELKRALKKKTHPLRPLKRLEHNPYKTYKTLLKISSGTPHKNFRKNMNSHQKMQMRKINKGLANGSITPREAKKLYKQQQKIKKIKRKALKDGYLSPAEKKLLKKKQHKARKHIRKEMNDTQRTIRRTRYKF